MVEDLHEGDRSGRDTSGGADEVVFGTKPGKRKAGPAAGLVNDRRLFDRLEDRLHRIFHRQHEAGGELLQVAAGIHQGGEFGKNRSDAIRS
ncbi:MAG: hypothetical protein MPW14_06545 [Candidatus Manganitrophus sp.]|nr:MAG: hypothetical protein MPW14_06545 [Candidatus Manganitrophus sp.]